MIQMNVSAIYHNALPPNITPSSSPGALSRSTLYDCWQSLSLALPGGSIDRISRCLRHQGPQGQFGHLSP